MPPPTPGRDSPHPPDDARPGAAPGSPASPAAARAPRRTWRDPRLVVGVVIVAASVLLGARLLADADDMTSVWAVRADVRAGSVLEAEDVERQDVRFGTPEQAAAYVAGADRLPVGATVGRDLVAGELLPRAALGGTPGQELVEVPLSVPSDAVVTSLSVGETVDVWVTPASARSGAGPGEDHAAERVLSGVRVVAVPEPGTALGPATTRQVVVGVPATEDEQLGPALARLASGSVVVVRRS